MKPLPVHLSAEVLAGLSAGRALVALESTVIAHGLPFPHNVGVATGCESAVRDAGAVPATLSVGDRSAWVGCDEARLLHLAQSKSVAKLSIRDLPVALALGGDGATTVATSLSLAEFVRPICEIDVFATGGIGGVHRGWESTLDVSADLPELANSDLVTVCAGAKAILDLPAAREWLETAGVTVVGWKTDEFPAFYSRSSGLPVDVRVESAEQVAEIALTRRRLELAGGLLVCVPVPESVAMDREEVEEAVKEALSAAAEEGVSGKKLTPYLLSRIAKVTQGRGLAANKALLLQNASVGGQIAVAYKALLAEET